MRKRSTGLAFLLGLSITACISFSYDRFGLDLENEKLLHYQTASKDLPLSRCAKVNGEFTCVVMFGEEFFKMKSEHERLIKQLADCQGGR